MAIVGAGPAGIAAVGKVLDEGFDPKTVAWIDPHFKVGDLGGKWSQVSGNTKIHRFDKFLRGSQSFNYDSLENQFDLKNMDPHGTCTLNYVVEPLQAITEQLRKKVVTIESSVSALQSKNGEWSIQLDGGSALSKNVILAVGAEPKKLNYSKPNISLEDALDQRKLASKVDTSDVVGVFGSSHSAVMSIQNLLDSKAKQVINFYNKQLRYAVDKGDWILYDNTGLKGRTAEWAKSNIDGKLPDGLMRVNSRTENIEPYLEQCTKVVYAVGFEPRSIQINGTSSTRYDDKTGIIAPGVFGCGFAFPERIVDRAGNEESNVGIYKFMRRLDSAFPVWMNSER